MLWHEKHPGVGKFDLWRDTRRLNIPVISELFEQFSSGSVLSQSVEQILEWTADALNRVDRAFVLHQLQKARRCSTSMSRFSKPSIRTCGGSWVCGTPRLKSLNTW